MKREFLTALFKKAELEVGKEVIDQIMDEHGKDTESLKSSLEAAKNDITLAKSETEQLKTQIADRDKDIEAMKTAAGASAELQTQLTELKTKYETASREHEKQLKEQTEELQKKLSDQAYSHAVEGFFSPLPFASELARKAAMADFIEKGFKLENGQFLGADDWVEKLKESDPAAFKQEEQEPGQPGVPRFTKSFTPSKDDHKKGFAGSGFNLVRPMPENK